MLIERTGDTPTGRVAAMLEHEQLTSQIIGAAIEVHRVLGLGLLEGAYQKCLAREFAIRDLQFEKELTWPIEYKGVQVESGYRLDFVVCRAVIVEVKTIELILPVHEAQLITYLKMTRLPVGLLVNFHVPVLKHGILRRANTRSSS